MVTTTAAGLLSLFFSSPAAETDAETHSLTTAVAAATTTAADAITMTVAAAANHFRPQIREFSGKSLRFPTFYCMQKDKHCAFFPITDIKRKARLLKNSLFNCRKKEYNILRRI